MNTQPHAQVGNHIKISDDWISETRLHAAAECGAISVTASDVQIWLNLRSGVFHFFKQRWYGKTQDGLYMGISNAQKSEHRATRNGQ